MSIYKSIKAKTNLLNKLRKKNITENKDNIKNRDSEKLNENFQLTQKKYLKEYKKLLELLEKCEKIELLEQNVYKIDDIIFTFYNAKFKTLICKLNKDKTKNNIKMLQEELYIPEVYENYDENRRLLFFYFTDVKAKLFNIEQSVYDENKDFFN